jgi:hypothetical protein
VARGEVKRQMGVALSDDLRDRLEKSADAAGHSVGEEIRQRLERTFAEDDARDPETRKLISAIADLAIWVRIQTNRDWHSHPAANRVLRDAITTYLARLKPSGEPVFAPGELPTVRLVAAGSDDPEAMGLALEALVFHTPPMTPERQRLLDATRAKAIHEMKKRHGLEDKS